MTHASAAGVLAGLVFACAALAVDDYEKNDTKATATGPLIEDRTYEADIDRLSDNASDQDDDWYVLWSKEGGSTIEIAYTNLQDAGNCFGPRAVLYDDAGAELGAAHPAKDKSETISHTAAGQSRYYLLVEPYTVIRCDAPTPYRFKATGVGPAPSAPAPDPGPGPGPGPDPGPGPGPGNGNPPPGKRNAQLAVTGARLGNYLRVTGDIDPDAPASKIRVMAWSGSGRNRIGFTIKGAGKPNQKGKWIASRLVPKALRGVRSLKFRASYLGTTEFEPKTLPSRRVAAKR